MSRPSPSLGTLQGTGILFYLLAAVLLGCAHAVPTERLEVVRTFPHDPEAYTQGLVFYDGRIFESTGMHGRSSVREVDPGTGEVVRIRSLEEEYFGEGIARVGSSLVQLTWKEETAFVYDLETFEILDTFEFEAEGWGLCHDGDWLYMTTGEAVLYLRDPATFELHDSRPITRGGRALPEVNDLACVGDYLYANVLDSDRIVRIAKESGEVVSEIDASILEPEGGRPDDIQAVLNGIAHDSESGTFYLTGKLWPTMFEVRFHPEAPPEE